MNLPYEVDLMTRIKTIREYVAPYDDDLAEIIIADLMGQWEESNNRLMSNQPEDTE